MESFLFDSGGALLRVTVVGVMAYASLILFLRISGKRTLSKLNAFDFVVTVALGSTLATVLLSRNVTLAQGALAFAVLVGLQFAITWSSVRVRPLRALLTGEPSLLLYHGTLLPAAMRRERVTEDEVRATLRASGLASLEEAEAVVLETDGSLSVVRSGDADGASTLAGLVPPPGERGAG